MKKRFFFLALVAVASISTPASEITIRCCDNSVHRFYAVSPEAFRQRGASDKEVQEYIEGLAQDVCGQPGCYISFGVSHIKDIHSVGSE